MYYKTYCKRPSLTLEDFLSMDEYNIARSLEVKLQYIYSGDRRGYYEIPSEASAINKSYDSNVITLRKIDGNIFKKLKQKYPYSGISEIEKEADARINDIVTRYNALNGGYSYKEYLKDVVVILYYKLYSQFPQLEKIAKCGFARMLTIDILNCYHGGCFNYRYHRFQDKNVFTEYKKALKRNFKNKDKLQDVCQIPLFSVPFVSQNVQNINQFSEMRILLNKYLKTKEDLNNYSTLANRYTLFSPSFARTFKALINTGLYTAGSLLDYLNRVDIYQAIEPMESITILKDYINMCKQLEIEPDIKTNSLKREHDLVMREFNNHKFKINSEKFNNKVEQFKKLEFKNKKYCIIAPTSPSDLFDEGRQQRNCVASYINFVANGKSIIMFLRNAKAPDKSLVTLEISPKDFCITQKYMAYNRPITDEKINNFLLEYEDFLKNIKIKT